MKVLMLGWEFPLKIYGGLTITSYGIARGLGLQGDMETTPCTSKPTDEEENFLNIVDMDQVPIVRCDVNYDHLESRLSTMGPEQYYALHDHIYSDFSYMHVNDLGCMDFAGDYPGNLHEEINNLSIITGVMIRQQEFDIIHAHDWLMYPAGVHAKMVSGKSLCIHARVTDSNRSRGKMNPIVYSTERDGTDYANCIMCVSELTRRAVINEYHRDSRKVLTMYNAVYPLPQELQDIPHPDHSRGKVVTFLGRIIMQKGPEYFVEAAVLVLQRTRNMRFVMAGSDDILNAMINLAAERGIADRFHPPGFMKGRQMHEVYKNGNVFVMPSVSEPLGIAPLEAMQYRAPSIISKQSGCGEAFDKVIKTDYRDIHAMAGAIYSICTNPSLFRYPQEEGKKGVDETTWEKIGLRICAPHEDMLRNYGE